MKAALITTAKNEGPYFLEWVAHHLEVGFTDIIVYQNDSDDYTHNILSALRDVGAIQYFYNKAGRGRHQVRAYVRGGSLPEFKDADWAMALDMDEFLVVKTGNGRLEDLIAATPDADVHRINWRIYGSSGHALPTSDLVMDRFRMANYQLGPEGKMGAFKCLFRPVHFTRPGIHRPAGSKVDTKTLHYCNGSGLPEAEYRVKNYNSSDPEGCKLAQINHYIVRDTASFMLKTVRGSAHQADRVIGHRYWKQRNMNFERDDCVDPFLGRVRARMEALDQASGGKLKALTEMALFKHLEQFYTMVQKKRHRQFLEFCNGTLTTLDPQLTDQEDMDLDEADPDEDQNDNTEEEFVEASEDEKPAKPSKAIKLKTVATKRVSAKSSAKPKSKTASSKAAASKSSAIGAKAKAAPKKGISA